MKFTTLFLFIAISFSAAAQSRIEKMYTQKRYKEIVALAPDAQKYGGKDLFVIGQSYLRLKDDDNAINMLKQAINKGYKNGEVYYALGVAQSNKELYTEAQTSFRQALFYLPNRKKVVIAMARSYYNQGNLDSALAVNQRIEKLWGDFMPASLMVCQIQYEQEKYSDAATCFYNKLHYFKQDNYYYREALEAIMRMEWHNFKNYDKAEKAIKNLMAEFPQQYEYNMLLMQLYNFTGRYAGAATQEKYLLGLYTDAKLNNKYYKTGVMLVEQFDTAQYAIEVYRNFQPKKHGNTYYRAFIFNADGSRALGKITGAETDTSLILTGYRKAIPQTAPKPMNYKNFRKALLYGLFAPQETVKDTIEEK